MKLKLKNVFLAYFLVSSLAYSRRWCSSASHVSASLPCGQQQSSFGRRI